MVTKEDWTTIVDTVRAKAADDNIPEWKCLFGYYSVCVWSIVSPSSQFIYRLYLDLGGLGRETVESYLRLPAHLLDAFHVIQEEQDRIAKIRKEQPNA